MFASWVNPLAACFWFSLVRRICKIILIILHFFADRISFIWRKRLDIHGMILTLLLRRRRWLTHIIISLSFPFAIVTFLVFLMGFSLVCSCSIWLLLLLTISTNIIVRVKLSCIMIIAAVVIVGRILEVKITYGVAIIIVILVLSIVQIIGSRIIAVFLIVPSKTRSHIVVVDAIIVIKSCTFSWIIGHIGIVVVFGRSVRRIFWKITWKHLRIIPPKDQRMHWIIEWWEWHYVISRLRLEDSRWVISSMWLLPMRITMVCWFIWVDKFWNLTILLVIICRWIIWMSRLIIILSLFVIILPFIVSSLVAILLIEILLERASLLLLRRRKRLLIWLIGYVQRRLKFKSITKCLSDIIIFELNAVMEVLFFVNFIKLLITFTGLLVWD